MKPLLVSSGEPAGIGPELCLSLADREIPVVVIGDKDLLSERARAIGKAITLTDYVPERKLTLRKNHLTILHIPCKKKSKPGILDKANAFYVIELLKKAIELCLSQSFSALVTAPVHKGIINEAGIPFTGHTEFLAAQCSADTVVMMLACPEMKVALVTTHLPLKDVPRAINRKLIKQVIQILNQSLINEFNLDKPKIAVAGLNPHAGENGYLGREEIEIINPCLQELQQQGLDVIGTLPADTMFTPHYLNTCDAFVAMYHDQGLPVLKYAGFGHAVNVTLGLPIIRTSVDHGTALDLAGRGIADAGSLNAAVDFALKMVTNREKKR